eukprot:788303-Prymnesium_polylepis.1
MPPPHMAGYGGAPAWGAPPLPPGPAAARGGEVRRLEGRQVRPRRGVQVCAQRALPAPPGMEGRGLGGRDGRG